MATSLEGDERFNGVTIRQAVKMTVWARNTTVDYQWIFTS